ncbi:MAG: hypothetical protein AB1757_00140 [Acidobacteriota bacterium]
MKSWTSNRQTGFTVLETAVVILIIGLVAAFATPQINYAIKEYRLNAASSQFMDAINKAKMQAISESNQAGIAVDINGRRMGVVTYKDDGVTVESIVFVPLPEGINFQRPTGVTAAPDGVTGSGVVSFPLTDGYYIQNFNTRGFPVVASGTDVVSMFFGNGKNYKAITISSVGGVRSYRLENAKWVNTRSGTTTN